MWWTWFRDRHNSRNPKRERRETMNNWGLWRHAHQLIREGVDVSVVSHGDFLFMLYMGMLFNRNIYYTEETLLYSILEEYWIGSQEIMFLAKICSTNLIYQRANYSLWVKKRWGDQRSPEVFLLYHSLRLIVLLRFMGRGWDVAQWWLTCLVCSFYPQLPPPK